MRGIILLNIGTPSECSKSAVENFVGNMLSDPLVLNKFQWVSRLLARKVIAPLSASKSLEKYTLIWRKEPPAISPLLFYMQQMGQKLEQQKNTPVEIAMRYGSPSIKDAFDGLLKKNDSLSEVIIFPLYPHYAQSSTQTSIDEVKRIYHTNSFSFKLKIIKPYYNHSAYIKALARHVEKYLKSDIDKLLFSYHSLPVHQVKKAWRKGKEFDYVYQLKETNQLLLKELGLNSQNKSLLFYSSQRGNGWLKPFLNKNIADLPALGWKRVAVISPGFPADNLETLYDVDIEARNLFMEAGGENFIFVPSLNAEDYWIEALWKIITTS